MKSLQVSVVIPSYNRATLVGETIKNLLRQTLPPYEIIVVDDGSTDNSVEVLEGFGDRVRIIQQANQGPGTARNTGWAAATGEYIQFQDSDDLYSLNKLEAQAKLLEASGADVAFSPWVKLRFHGRQVVLEDHVLQQEMPPAKLELAHWLLRGWSTVFQSLLFRRSFLDKIGPYRTDLMPSEDTELFFRILTSSPRVVFTDEALLLYRLHDLNKITQDEGVSRARRVTDWSRCMQHIIQRQEASGMKLDWRTRAIFLVGIRKHLLHEGTESEAALELKQWLSARVAQAPAAWLATVELWLRGSEYLRRHRRGARWMSGYQSSGLTEQQLRLIREAGFEVRTA